MRFFFRSSVLLLGATERILARGIRLTRMFSFHCGHLRGSEGKRVSRMRNGFCPDWRFVRAGAAPHTDPNLLRSAPQCLRDIFV